MSHLIFFTVVGLSQMGVSREPEETSFSLWFGLHNLEFYPPEIGANIIPVEMLEELKRVPKSEFFETFSNRLRERGTPS